MNTILDFQNWIHALGGDLPDAEKRLAKIIAAYHEPHRRYHTSAHVFAVLSWLADRVERFPDKDADPNVVLLAGLYHDAIFAIGAKDNEERSAEWAAADMRRAGISASWIARVVIPIMDTRHMTPPPTIEGRLMVDADLISLALPFDHTWANTMTLWEESGAAVGPFAKGTIGFLNSLLARPTIYRSLHMEREEAVARENIPRIITRLRRFADAA